MTIDDRLFQLLTSPAVIAAIGDRWFPLQVKQGIAPPYATYAPISSPPINTMDHQQETRQWRYQLSIFDDVYATAVANLNETIRFLTAFTGFHDIQRVLEIGARSARYLDQQRVYMAHADVDIMENLP